MNNIALALAVCIIGIILSSMNMSDQIQWYLESKNLKNLHRALGWLGAILMVCSTLVVVIIKNIN